MIDNERGERVEMKKKKKTSRLKLHLFVYKPNIDTHKTVSNEKDMNNLFN